MKTTDLSSQVGSRSSILGGSIVPWLGMSVLIILLAVSQHRFKLQSEEVAAFHATVSSSLQMTTMRRDSILHAGDRLPAAPQLRNQEVVIPLSRLPELGYRYLYLYRDDCSGCVDLMPAWTALRTSAGDSVAFIQYRLGHDESATVREPHRYAALGTTAESSFPLTEYVPAMLVVRGDGMIESVADGFAAVVRHLELFNLVPPGTIRPGPVQSLNVDQ